MILIGEANRLNSLLAPDISPEYIINFTGLIEYIPRSILVPDFPLGATTEYDFDMKYRDWLLMDNARFLEVFRIASCQINGGDVYLIKSSIADEYTFAYNIIESFLKFMQYRYGTRSLYINDDEDWLIYRNDSIENNITMSDQFIIDDDFKRFCALTAHEEY